jgi:uncharacterized protein
VESPPQFRFSPNAYALGFIVEEPGPLVLRARPRGWRYHGSFDATEFNDQLNIEGIPEDPDEIEGARDEPMTVDADAAREVSTHPVLPLLATGALAVPLRTALRVHRLRRRRRPARPASRPGPDRRSRRWQRLPADLLRGYLTRDRDLTGHLFRCLTCEAHHLHVDAS